jgi:vitamin B12 transporter
VNVGGRGRYEIAPFISAIANARYAEGTLEIDGFPAPAFTLADTDEYQKTREVSALGGLVFDNTRSRVAATFSHARTQRENFASQTAFAPSFASDGSAQRAEITAQHRFDGPVMLRAGGDVEWSRYDTGAASVAQRTLKAAYAQASWLTDALDASAGARVDDYEGFGSDVSLGADAALRLTGDLRLRASFGEGFKAPTLYQLLSEYGNETLDAERSSSVDAGLVYATPGAPLFASAGIFRRDTKNLIAFVSCFGSADPICDNRPFGTYDNVGLARAQGFEAELAWQFVPGARLGAVYGFVEAENRTPGDANEGNELARRPRHAATFSLDYAPLASAPGLSLGADLRVVSASFDDPGNSVRLEGYEVVDLRASVGIGGNLEVFGRVENATDAQYQTAAGYGTQGRAGFAGIRLRR